MGPLDALFVWFQIESLHMFRHRLGPTGRPYCWVAGCEVKSVHFSVVFVSMRAFKTFNIFNGSSPRQKPISLLFFFKPKGEPQVAFCERHVFCCKAISCVRFSWSTRTRATLRSPQGFDFHYAAMLCLGIKCVAVVMMKMGNGYIFAESITCVMTRFVLVHNLSSVLVGTKLRTSRNRSSWNPAANLFPGLLWSVHFHDGGVADHPRCSRWGQRKCPKLVHCSVKCMGPLCPHSSSVLPIELIYSKKRWTSSKPLAERTETTRLIQTVDW